MREADQLKNDALEVILSGCHQRVLRPGQPAYQSLNEIGCIAEMVHKALARTLKVVPPKSLDSWRSMLPQHGLQCPSSITHLHHSYGWRNKCSHDDFDKEYFDRAWAEKNLGLVTGAIRHLDHALATTEFRRQLLAGQSFNLPYKLAATLQAALHSCVWSASLDSAITDYAAAAALPSDFVDDLRDAETVRGSLLEELLAMLAEKDLNPTANHLRELAATVASAISSADYAEHLDPWFARNDLRQPPAHADCTLPTLRFTLDTLEGESGPFFLTRVELLHPPNESVTRVLHQFEDRPLERLRDLVREVKGVGNNVVRAGGGELDDYVVQLRVPLDQVVRPFHDAEEALSGLVLGELCRCLTVQLLLPPEEEWSYDRRSLNTLVGHPQTRPTNSTSVSEPVPARAISRLWKKQRFACLFALESAAIRTADAQQIVQSFQRYPLCIADRDGKHGDDLVESLFDGTTECGLGDLFDRVTELRHPDSGAGLPLLVLWDDAAYQPHQPESLSR